MLAVSPYVEFDNTSTGQSDKSNTTSFVALMMADSMSISIQLGMR